MNNQSKVMDKANFSIDCFKLTQEMLRKKIDELNLGKYSFDEFIEMMMQYLKITFVHNVMLLIHTDNRARGKNINSKSELKDKLIKVHIDDIIDGFKEFEAISNYMETIKNEAFH